MDNRNEKEKWVNEVLNSTAGMKKAEGNPFLYEKIMFRLREKETIPVLDGRPLIFLPKWIIAGVFILVINGIAISREIGTPKTARPNDNYTGMLSELGNQTTYNY